MSSVTIHAPKLARDTWHARGNYLAALRRARDQHGDALRLRFPRDVLFLFHPVHVHSILKDNARNYRKSDNYRHLRPLLGSSLLTTDGEEWRQKRRAVAPEFHAAAINDHDALIARHASAMLDDWEQKECIDSYAEFARLTMRIACELILGVDLEERGETIEREFVKLTRGAVRRAMLPFSLPSSWPTPGNLATRRSIREIHAIIDDAIAARGSTGVLRRLAESSPKEMRDEALTLILAGYETTALALTWLCQSLAWHSQTQENARADGKYLIGAIHETLRLYPSIPIFSRNALASAMAGEVVVRPGQFIHLVPWVTHRHPDFWPDADQFLPERFLAKAPHNLHPGAYFPFGIGARECIGNHLALKELGEIAKLILQRFKITPVSAKPISPKPVIMLRPLQKIILRPRAFKPI